jgi:hypothetical protein
MMTEQIVTKLNAAIRQLDCAITLYFQDGDPVPIHTLACAAHQVVHNINRHNNGPELLFDSLTHKGRKTQVSKALLHKQYNFFKHADSDPCPNCGIRFDQKLTEIFMLSAIQGVLSISGSINQKESAFVVYVQLHNELLFFQEICHLLVHDISSDVLQELRNIKKGKFLKEFLCACR